MEKGNIDYGLIGFKCGLEIHQQLSGKKLFCNCPVNAEGKDDVRFERKIRAVAGETGEVDTAARYEMKKGRKFLYESSSSNTCLVEYDEEPPHPVNRDALETALTVALLLKAKVVDEIHFMRKTVVDGSNVSGFQRTALIATDGIIETSKGNVSVPTICIEEEAAQKVEHGEDFVKYNLNRLGIPLIEIATGTDIMDAEHAKETAGIIGMILRSTGKVVRGIGSIRQDVNLSISGGARTEVKGFQDLRAIPKVIDFEIERQQKLIAEGKKIEQEVRKAESDFTTSFLRPMPGSSRLYPETDIPPIEITKDDIEKLGGNLPKLITQKVEDVEKKYSLSNELAKEIISEDVLDVFSHLVKKFDNVEPKVIAHTILNIPKEIKTRFGIDSGKITHEDIELVLSFLNAGKIPKEAVIELLASAAKEEELDVSKYAPVSEDVLEGEIRQMLIDKAGLSTSAYMGMIMGKYRGKVDGKRILDLLNKYIKE